LFGTWLGGISTVLKPIVLLGVAATIWSIWLCRNDLVFEKKNFTLLLGYLLGYTLAPYMDYLSEAGCTVFGCGGYATLGTGGQGYILPGTWVVF
jgi:hypothetical protein